MEFELNRTQKEIQKAVRDLQLIDQRITGEFLFNEKVYTEPLFIGAVDPKMLPLPGRTIPLWAVADGPIRC